jgi:hypothetical protein
MANRRFVLGVDLDGVCADFYEGLRVIAAEWLGVPVETLTRDVTYGLPQWNLDRCGDYEDLHRFAEERDLFRNLMPIHGAAAALRRIAHQQQVRIRIITHRLFISHFHHTAINQTVEWLDHHPRHAVLGSLFYARQGRSRRGPICRRFSLKCSSVAR